MQSIGPSVSSRLRWSTATLALALGAAVAACSGQHTGALTGPSSIGATEVKAPSNGDTSVSFQNFDVSTLEVTIKTTTTSGLGQPYIDQGKIHLEILVDGSTGQPVPCGTVGGIWVRFDQIGGGIDVSGGVTQHDVDLDNLRSRNIEVGVGSGVYVQNASCGDSICVRAQYVTGGGQTHVDTHFSTPTPYQIICSGTCTLTQGYWKTHGPIPLGNNTNTWPVTSLMLGTVSYTDLQLLSIFNTPPAGNGLLSLAHQLIAAKLNIIRGADDSAIAATIIAADTLIDGLVVPPVGSGSLNPSATSALTDALDDYNSGLTGPGHCGG
jgi:hypothetical protein